MFQGPIEILKETEIDHGWRFNAQCIEANGTLRSLTIGLNWADYDLLCPDGSTEPSLVAETVLRWLITNATHEQLAKGVDASLARRIDPTADSQIRRLFIQRGQP